MKYRKDKLGRDISILGYGCMRFTKKGLDTDIDKAEKEVKRAIELGVNYFDTAYVYPGNEVALGTILERTGLRDKIYIATKLPHYLVKSLDDAKRIFSEELERLKTDHVDFYLIHILSDVNCFDRLKGLGVIDFLDENKRQGKIGQIGFSYHGNPDMFIELCDHYNWDFTQIQYNYLDEHAQAGITGLKHANLIGLPVIIMEPLRGGRLVNNLPKAAIKAFNETEIKRSPAEWSFRWLWDHSEVTCVLSGMNDMTQVEENCAWADHAVPGIMDEKEKAMLKSVVNAINEKMKVPCTACRYCMPCPMGIDIPTVFNNYNRFYTDSKYVGLRDYCSNTVFREKYAGPAACINCKKCMSHCPQGIKIPEELKKAKRTLEFPGFKILLFVARKLWKIKKSE